MAECIDTIGRPIYLGPAERAGSALGRTVDKFLTFTSETAASALDGLLTWQRRSRERAVLAGLPDDMLKDVGLTRADVEIEANKPFWLR